MTPYAVAILAVLIVIAAMLFLVFASGSTHGGYWGSNGTSKMRTVTISATGFASATPSEADMSLVVNATGKTTQEAVQNITAALGAFNSTIGSYIGKNFSLVTTTYFNLYPRIIYNYSNGTYTSHKSGYIATENLLVKLPDVNSVGSAIWALSNIPNIYVSSVSRGLSDAQIGSMRSEALSNALANATSQAIALVGADNLTTESISISNYYVYPYYASAAPKGLNATAVPQYYGGMNQVTESITVTFSYGSKAGYWTK